MIINGGSRVNGGFFAKHLMRPDTNERVEVCEMRGVCADNIRDALAEMEAVARGTAVKNYFYHANINPRDDERLTPAQWREAVDTLERNLGLEGQTRFVVEHEKEGRTHRHVIWSRVDLETMRGISDSLNYQAHERTSRELEIAFGLERGESVLVPKAEREGPRPERTPEFWAMQRGKESGIDPRAVKREASEVWAQADSGQAFKAAIEERGYILARGNRRDFCIVDSAGNNHSLARRLSDAKEADVRERMADVDRAALPSVAEAKEFQAERRHIRETERQEGRTAAIEAYTAKILEEQAAARDVMAERQEAERAAIRERPSLSESDKGMRLAKQALTHEAQRDRLDIWHYEDRQRAGIADPERDAVALRLIMPEKFAEAAADLTRTGLQKDLAEEARREHRPAPPLELDESVAAFLHHQEASRTEKLADRRDSQAAAAAPGKAAQAENAVHGMERSAERVFAAMCKTGEKLIDLVEGVGDLFFATPRTVTPQEAAASRQAMAEYMRAAAFEEQRDRSYDRMMEERAAGRHLNRDDVRYLSEADRTNYRRHGDAALDQMLRDREIELERERKGRSWER